MVFVQNFHIIFFSNKPEQAIELHSNPNKEKIIIEKKIEKPEIGQQIRIPGQNRIPDKFLHPETPQTM